MGYLKDNDIKAVCFDIDGTLYDKKALDLILVKTSLFHLPFALKYLSMRSRIRKEDGYNDFSASSSLDFKKREMKIMYPNKNKDISWFIDKEKRVFHDKWEKDFLHVSAFADMNSVLREIASVVPVALLSDFPIGSKLKAFNIEDVASYVVSSEDIGRLKPSRLPFRILYEHFNLNPNDMLYVGDSEKKDVLGAKNAGMHSMLITKNKNKAKESRADLVVSSFSEMRKVLL